MTAQFREVLFYNGEELAMCNCPLNNFLRLSNCAKQFLCNCTALWRGYVGTWEIVDSRLYLIKISGEFVDGTPASLEAIFPGYPDRVFAHWYSGSLRIPFGKMVKYVHMGFGSVYESNLFLIIEKGVLVNTHQENNND